MSSLSLLSLYLEEIQEILPKELAAKVKWKMCSRIQGRRKPTHHQSTGVTNPKEKKRGMLIYYTKQTKAKIKIH